MNEFSTQVEILEKSIKLGTPPQKKKKIVERKYLR